MASPNSTWTEALTVSLNSRTKKLADNVSNNNAILTRMKEKGRIRTADGGVSILQELQYAENATFQGFSGFETLGTTSAEIASAAEYDWKQCAAAVVISGLEQLKNSGEERMINHLSSKISNAELTMSNGIATGLYSDGTGSSSKIIGGLQLIVADTNTNTVGGISGTTYSWWKNFVYDVSSVQSSAASATNIQTHMNATYVNICRNNEAPDLILTDNVYYKLYLGSLQTIQRITTDKMASAGFTSLRYMGADVVLDGGRGGNCPASHMYFLNTDYLFFRPHADRNMVPLDPDRFSVNQDALVKLIGWAGNLTCANRFMQAVMKA